MPGTALRREERARTVQGKIRPGEQLLIDYAHRYFAAPSRAPLTIGEVGIPPTNRWGEVARLLAHWKCTRTSDDVCDTAWWRKPPA